MILPQALFNRPWRSSLLLYFLILLWKGSISNAGLDLDIWDELKLDPESNKSQAPEKSSRRLKLTRQFQFHDELFAKKQAKNG